MLGFAMFLAGNSAIFTATWVRQYGLFTLIYCLSMLQVWRMTEPNRSRSRQLLDGVLIGLICVLGMMTQYTFLTLTAPLHLALLMSLLYRREFFGFCVTLANYVSAAAIFIALLPGVFKHVKEVSAGQPLHNQFSEACRGFAGMFAPMPSSLPVSLYIVIGLLTLLIPIIITFFTLKILKDNGSGIRSRFLVLSSSIIGAGFVQFALTSLGLYPKWATGPNHTCAFWVFTVVSISIFLHFARKPVYYKFTLLAFLSAAALQSLFIFHTIKTRTLLNTSYVSTLKPDLVLLDNSDRGYVLQITDILPAEQFVLLTDSPRLDETIGPGAAYSTILYLPMERTVMESKASITSILQDMGYGMKELPVLHPGMFEAILLTADPKETAR